MAATDKDLVYGYFLAERMLNTITPDDTILDVGFADCDDIPPIYSIIYLMGKMNSNT